MIGNVYRVAFVEFVKFEFVLFFTLVAVDAGRQRVARRRVRLSRAISFPRLQRRIPPEVVVCSGRVPGREFQEPMPSIYR
jgi:hypothetical protein